MGKIISKAVKTATKRRSRAQIEKAYPDLQARQTKVDLKKAIKKRESGRTDLMDEFDMPASRGSGKRTTNFPKDQYKKGGKVMLKRADGSYSQRGLWDNIRANKGSGKKPTAAMLKQERKIKAKTFKKIAAKRKKG